METGMDQVPGEVVGEEQGLMEVVRPLGILMVSEANALCTGFMLGEEAVVLTAASRGVSVTNSSSRLGGRVEA